MPILCSVKDIDGLALNARDGEIGNVSDVYFDDARWVVRHLVVSTGNWLPGRKVLISPHSITGIDRKNKRLDVELSRKQVEGAPDIDTDRPISRQEEASYYDYYGYPYYWAGAGLWGAAAFPLTYPMAGPALVVPPPGAEDTSAADDAKAAQRESGDSHLRSSDEVIGYDVEASDGAAGHIDDFVFDDQSWAIRYAVVDTSRWLSGKQVLISPRSIESVSWDEKRVSVKMTKQAVKARPEYDRTAPIEPTDEQRLQEETHAGDERY